MKTSFQRGYPEKPFALGLLCLSPSHIFRKLIEEENPRSIILTSGTLSPLCFLEKELQTDFKIQLSNANTMDHERAFVRIV